MMKLTAKKYSIYIYIYDKYRKYVYYIENIYRKLSRDFRYLDDLFGLNDIGCFEQVHLHTIS